MTNNTDSVELIKGLQDFNAGLQAILSEALMTVPFEDLKKFSWFSYLDAEGENPNYLIQLPGVVKPLIIKGELSFD